MSRIPAILRTNVLDTGKEGLMDVSRVIIHSDMNAFYAGVEQAERPELRGLPIIVGGDAESRHGIVLTASYEAKRRGFTQGEG